MDRKTKPRMTGSECGSREKEKYITLIPLKNTKAVQTVLYWTQPPTEIQKSLCYTDLKKTDLKDPGWG